MSPKKELESEVSYTITEAEAETVARRATYKAVLEAIEELMVRASADGESLALAAATASVESAFRRAFPGLKVPQ